MKQIKSFFYISVMTSLMIMIFSGTVYGATASMQREGALQGSQESAAAKDSVTMDENQLTFAFQRLKNKNGSGIESETGRHSVKMERYKPYHGGEGERKIK